jgi:hypothetical protein
MTGLAVEPQTAEGCALVQLVRLISGSTRLIERLGVETQAEAEERIHWPGIDDPDETQRPFIVVAEGEYMEQKVAGGAQNRLMPVGTLQLLIADNAQHLPDQKSSLIEFTNFAGGIVRDVADCAGDGTNSIISIERVGTHILSDKTEDPGRKPYWWGEYLVRWNPIG